MSLPVPRREEPPGDANCVVPLSRLARGVDSAELRGDALVRGVRMDSRRVEPGDLFLASPGATVDGARFAGEAVRRGAVALAVERALPLDVAQLVVPSVRRAAGPIAAAFYGGPSGFLDVVGVTGTNGKTTTCQLVRACLATAEPSGQITTLGLEYGTTRRTLSGLTTPEAPELQAALAELARNGVRGVAMEVSSHGLEQHRVDAVEFAVGIFTGLSPEHLDYHGTMEQYLGAKAKLFAPERCGRALVSTDTPWGVRLAQQCTVPVVTFGTTGDADMVVATRSLGLSGIEVAVDGPGEHAVLASPLVGTVNGMNVAAAYLAARALGIDRPAAERALRVCPPPQGRFEVVTADEPFWVAIDYAHTPDALEAVIDTARAIAPGRIHVVLGARGDRYRAKRERMVAVATRADRVVLTTDSPGSEDPRAILEELEDHVPPGAEGRCSTIPGRAEAIRTVVGELEPGDLLLVTGRGHEGVQHVAGRAVPLDDRVVARLALGRRPEHRPEGAPGELPGEGSVSVVVPARDAEATLERALRSALAQRPAPTEVIVVDDGSADRTAEIANAFGAKVQVVHQQGVGPSAARNAGIAQASSAWIAFLDADDEWAPGKLAAQWAALRRFPDAVGCATDWSRDLPAAAGASGGPAGPDGAAGAGTPVQVVTVRDLVVLNRFQTSTAMVRRDVLCRIGGFDPALDGAEDLDCWVRVAHHGRIVKVASPLVRYEDTPTGYSKDLDRHRRAALAVVQRELGAGGLSGAGQILAWHHLRFAVAHYLLGERTSAAACVTELRRARLVGPAVLATPRYLVPFLGRRAVRRFRTAAARPGLTTGPAPPG